MKIIYLTTARHPDDYRNFLKKYNYAPNPSNQNFHTKLINLLTSEFDVSVFSTLPMEKSLFVSGVNKDNYLYARYLNVPLIKTIGILSSGQREADAIKPELIVVDVMNVSLLKLAREIKHRHKIKVLGVLTDNPLNITKTKKEYSENVFKLSKVCDGFLTLTEGLVRLFDAMNKPYFVTPGFVDKSVQISAKREKYAFFAGALYDRYGVSNLIDAFGDDDVPFKLYIAGHGPLSEDLKGRKHNNIVFLGHITPEEVAKYQAEASVNINPRPKDEQIDLYSVPSKLLDYINSGTITLSTHNEEIYNLVGDNIYWISDNDPHTIKNALIEIASNFNTYLERARIAKEALIAKLDADLQLKKIRELIKKL